MNKTLENYIKNFERQELVTDIIGKDEKSLLSILGLGVTNEEFLAYADDQGNGQLLSGDETFGFTPELTGSTRFERLKAILKGEGKGLWTYQSRIDAAAEEITRLSKRGLNDQELFYIDGLSEHVSGLMSRNQQSRDSKARLSTEKLESAIEVQFAPAQEKPIAQSKEKEKLSFFKALFRKSVAATAVAYASVAALGLVGQAVRTSSSSIDIRGGALYAAELPQKKDLKEDKKPSLLDRLILRADYFAALEKTEKSKKDNKNDNKSSVIYHQSNSKSAKSSSKTYINMIFNNENNNYTINNYKTNNYHVKNKNKTNIDINSNNKVYAGKTVNNNKHIHNEYNSNNNVTHYKGNKNNSSAKTEQPKKTSKPAAPSKPDYKPKADYDNKVNEKPAATTTPNEQATKKGIRLEISAGYLQGAESVVAKKIDPNNTSSGFMIQALLRSENLQAWINNFGMIYDVQVPGFGGTLLTRNYSQFQMGGQLRLANFFLLEGVYMSGENSWSSESNRNLAMTGLEESAYKGYFGRAGIIIGGENGFLSKSFLTATFGLGSGNMETTYSDSWVKDAVIDSRSINETAAWHLTARADLSLLTKSLDGIVLNASASGSNYYSTDGEVVDGKRLSISASAQIPLNKLVSSLPSNISLTPILIYSEKKDNQIEWSMTTYGIGGTLTLK